MERVIDLASTLSRGGTWDQLEQWSPEERRELLAWIVEVQDDAGFVNKTQTVLSLAGGR